MLKFIRNLGFAAFARGFFYLFFVFLPFRIDALFWTSEIYSSGFFSPYLSHFFYISDLFLILSLLFLGLSLIFGRKNVITKFAVCDWRLFTLILVFFGLAIFSVFLSVDKLNSVFHVLRLFEFLMVVFLLINRFVNVEKLLYIFISVVTVTAIIGIFQYLLQHSLGLNFFGEPIVSANLPGVAKVSVFDKKFLRAYGTFAHPNIFAGYLVFAIFFIFHFLKKSVGKRRVLFSLLMIPCVLALIFTFSRSAFLALVSASLLYYSVSGTKISWKYVVLAFLLIMFFVVVFDLSSLLAARFLISGEDGFSERSQLLFISKKMFLDNVFGVGAGNFTAVMQNYSYEKLMPWNYQPVHNIYLLVLNELGVQGFLSFIGLFGYMFLVFLEGLKSKIVDKFGFLPLLMSLWLIVFVIGLFDHHFISLYQGQALFWLFVGLGGACCKPG